MVTFSTVCQLPEIADCQTLAFNVQRKKLLGTHTIHNFTRRHILSSNIQFDPCDRMTVEGKVAKWSGLGKLILGSKSWSRKTLLRELAVPDFAIVVADIDESAITANTPQSLVLSIGLAKARAILSKKGLKSAGEESGKTILVCGDSVVTHKGQILGKPRSKEHARSILQSYATAPATTVSSIVVVDVRTERYWADVGEAEVYFRKMPEHVIEDLVENGGAMDSAGGLRIEHPQVAKYTECIIGERSAVMGFSQTIAKRLLENAIEDCADGKPLWETSVQ